MCHSLPKKKYNMNYVQFSSMGQQIYVMLNHRVAYLCWMDALRKGYIKRNAFLCHIDWHTDFFSPRSDILDENAKIQDDQERELEEFVRNKLNESNADFIIPAMDRGLIGDALSIIKEECEGHFDVIESVYLKRTTDRIEFVDKGNNTHAFYLGGSSIKELVGSQGLLTDTFQHQDVQKAFNKDRFDRNIVLDIDLDYFTYKDSEGVWAMNERNIDLILKSDGFRYLLNFARVITIALEPYYCGDPSGYEECKHVLSRLSVNLREYLDIDIEKPIIDAFKEDLQK